jgi:group I intron endonuclease
MKELIINNTVILFLNINDMINLKKGELITIKEDYLKNYDNCIIYTYHDLKNHKKIIQDKINKLKFINQKKINARECTIKHIENADKNIFLNKNHIQGTDKSQIFYGTYFDDELIAVMTFEGRRKLNGILNEGEYDLSRFAVKLGLIVVGLFNKILNKFILDYSPKKIISYADLNVVNKENNIYAYNKFKLDKHIKTDFKIYLKNTNELYHKFTYGSKYFNNIDITKEIKNNVKENSVKIWNCGKLKYELNFNENNSIIYGLIYLIKNKSNNKVYVGQTTRTLNKRIYEYKKAYNKNVLYNPYLLNAFNKYGWGSFEFSVIDNATSIYELNEKEIFYIKKYNALNKNFGYNIELGGNNSLPSEETLKKMSDSHSGIKQNEHWVKKRIASAGTTDAKKYGKIKTNDDKIYLSVNSPKFWLGKERSLDTKIKISETKINAGLSKKQKEAICKKVYKTNLNNKLIKIYESTSEASKHENVNQSTISRWCQNNKKANGYYWSYSQSDIK